MKGTHHQENWDDYIIIDEPSYYLFIVFDGVSSAKNGKGAVAHAKNYVEKNYKQLELDFNIRRLMFELNNDLLASEMAEAYSTYCAVFYHKINEKYSYSWLGDSRLYAISNQYLEPLTVDDSFSKNFITKFLGHAHLNYQDFREVHDSKEDKHLLICTDGFYRLLESNKLAFFDYFMNKSLNKIKKGVTKLVEGKNFDDSTFIFLK
jgi:serine/threonine protein phosphatase PrpC